MSTTTTAAAVPPEAAHGGEADTVSATPPASATPFTTAAALQLVGRRIHSLEVLRQFHKHHCWMQTVQMTRRDIEGSFPNAASRVAFTTDCVYLGLGAGRVVDAAPRGAGLLNACRQLVREFAFHKSSSPLQAAQLLAARVTPYQFLPDGQATQVSDSRSIALHKHRGTGAVVFQYLQQPALPFPPDYLETLQATCAALRQMYEALRALVENKRDGFGVAERDKLGKIDAGVLTHFIKPLQKRLTLKAQQILEVEIGLLAQAE